MSLRVWLPLNGTLNNLGLLSLTSPNNVGAIINSAGKIGSCYSFNGSNQRIEFTHDKTIWNNKEISICMWYKYAEGNTTCTMVDIAADLCLSYTYSSSQIRFNYWRAYSNNGTRTGDSGSSNYYDASQWHHVVLTCDHNINKIYIDGILDSTFDRISKYTTNWMPLLAASYNKITLAKSAGSNPYGSGYLNDVRIYDHCLSAAEVKEIAQGLILHYKLDGINNASVLPSQYQQLEYIESTGTSYFNTGYKFNAEIDSCKIIFKGNDTSNNGMIFASAGDKYFWFYYYGSNGIRIYANNGSDGQKGITGISSDLIQHTMEFKNKTYYIDGVNKGSLTNTYTDTTNNIWLFSYNNNGYPFKGRIYYVEIKKNNQYQRIFIPAKRLNDSAIGMYDLITNTFYTSNNVAFTAGSVVGTLTIQDSSGYNHNGQMISNINTSTDTMRYNISALFDGVDDCIIVPYNTICPENIFTMNLWFKKDALGSKNYETLFGGPSGFEMDTRSGSSTALSLYMASTRGGNAATGLQLNTWYMVTMVRNGTNERYYINGELKKEIEAKAMPTGVYRIGAWASNTGQNYYGNISDFRIYCTPLLDTDIKQLYNVSMKIDNKQQIHTFELYNKSTNLLRSELIMPAAKAGYTSRIGEITMHNNTYAYNIAPAPFYKNISDSESGILKGQFAANTSYILDMWIDVDSVIYNGNNVAGGLTVRYTDGTSDTKFVLTGGNKGYQHRILITPNNKTIDRLDIYYYTSTDVFYRTDSYIGVYTTEKIKKTGILDTGNLSEMDNITQFVKGGHIHTKQIIER